MRRSNPPGSARRRRRPESDDCESRRHHSCDGALQDAQMARIDIDLESLLNHFETNENVPTRALFHNEAAHTGEWPTRHFNELAFGDEWNRLDRRTRCRQRSREASHIVDFMIANDRR